jgi:hypothetical protein
MTDTSSEIYEAVENIRSLKRRDAAALTDKLIDELIWELRRDQTLPARTFAQWALALADRRNRTAETIARLIDGLIDQTEALNTIEAVR